VVKEPVADDAVAVAAAAAVAAVALAETSEAEGCPPERWVELDADVGRNQSAAAGLGASFQACQPVAPCRPSSPAEAELASAARVVVLLLQ